MDSTQHKPGLYYVTLGQRNEYLIQPTGEEADVLADALRECAQAARHAG